MRKRLLWLIVILALGVVPVRAVVATRVTVGVTPTVLYTAPSPANAPGRVLVRNPSTVSVYVGAAAVTTATGFEVAPGDAVGLNVLPGDTVYGIVAAATQVVHVLSGYPQ